MSEDSKGVGWGGSGDGVGGSEDCGRGAGGCRGACLIEGDEEGGGSWEGDHLREGGPTFARPRQKETPPWLR